MTLVYAALGAAKAWEASNDDAAKDRLEHPGVFAYDVAEPFGEAFGRRLLTGHDPYLEARNIFVAAGYDDREVMDVLNSQGSLT